MKAPDCNRTPRKSSWLETWLKSLSLKTVLKAARWAYLTYKVVSNVIDWISQLMD